MHDVCNTVGLSYGTCQQILLDELNMRRIAAKYVTRLLSNDQKEYHIPVCTELKEQAENNPNFISSIITGDEYWVSGYNLKRSSSRLSGRLLTSLQPKKAQQVRSNFNSILVCFLTLKALCIRNLFQQERH
jgi:hypothetical protein